MTFRFALVALLALFATLAPSTATEPTSAAAPTGRLIVLGFDGADARTTERFMDEGLLPNLARLRETGTFAPLGTTMPAESPVSWAALNSGQNPAKTGIPGFVKRELAADGTPMPALGHVTHTARRSDTFDLPFLERTLLGWNPILLAACVGVGSMLVFLAVFAGLLKIRARMAVPMALVLGGVGAVATHVSAGYVPRSISDVVGNPTKTAPFWEVAAHAGVKSVVIDSAMSWDRPEVPGARVLSGLGVPDVRSNNGDWFVYTTDPKVIERAPIGQPTSTAGRIFRVDERDGRIESWIYGPFDFVAIDAAEREIEAIEARLGKPGQSSGDVTELRKRKREIQNEVLPRLQLRDKFRSSDEGRVSVRLVVDQKPDGAHVAIGEQVQVLQEGQWSTWYRLTFELSPLVKVRAITRVKLVKKADPFELFVDFLQFDPAHPAWWQPVSQPPEFAADLAHAADAPYETVGWACLTMPFKDREIDPVTFLEDIEATQRSRETLMRAAFGQPDWRALMFVESTPDRVQHMMYQFADPTHPAYDATKAAQKARFFGEEIALSDAIRASYQSMDRVVGEVVKDHLKPGDTLLVCADHGFQSFKRQAHLNNWLAKEGYLAVAPGTTPSGARALAFVDWPRTKAYAVGLGGVYLNLKGREGEGTVDPADAAALLAEIRAKLLAAEDQPGRRAVRKVYITSEIHDGPYLGEEPDLIVGFDAGWRVSWATTLGDMRLVESSTPGVYVPADVFEDNRLNWSGDHVSVADDLVRGIFFSNRKVVVPTNGIDLLHIAPTALAALGVPVPKEYDHPPLEFRE